MSAIRRPQQDGQKPLCRQENATSRSFATGRTANTNEAVAEQATCQELAKFAFYECRHAAVPCRSLCQKGLEVLLYHAVEERILGRTALVFDGGNLSRDRKGEKSARDAICVP